MSYIKGVWQDHIVSRPYTYRMVQNTDGTITLIPAFGEIDQLGTNVTAARLNHIEDGVEAASNVVDALQTWRQGMDADANVQQAQAILSDVADAEENITEVIASIPRDYTDTVNRVSNLEKADGRLEADMKNGFADAAVVADTHRARLDDLEARKAERTDIHRLDGLVLQKAERNDLARLAVETDRLRRDADALAGTADAHGKALDALDKQKAERNDLAGLYAAEGILSAAVADIRAALAAKTDRTESAALAISMEQSAQALEALRQSVPTLSDVAAAAADTVLLRAEMGEALNGKADRSDAAALAMEADRLSRGQDAHGQDIAALRSADADLMSGIAARVPKPATDGSSGQVLSTDGEGGTAWIDAAAPTGEQIGEAVAEWLDDHPEATTTVEDGSVTLEKLAADARAAIEAAAEAGGDQALGAAVAVALQRHIREDHEVRAHLRVWSEWRGRMWDYASLFRADGIGFLFYTDPHSLSDHMGMTMQDALGHLRIIRRVFEDTPARYVLFGGDWIDDAHPLREAMGQVARLPNLLRSEIGGPVYLTAGNHDFNTESTGEQHLTQRQLARIWFDRDVGYYTIDSDRVTCVVLDSGPWDNASYYWQDAYDTAQAHWFAALLRDNQRPHLYGLIHNLAPNDTDGWLDTQVTAIADAFNRRGTYTLDGSSYNFSNASGTFHFFLAGHIHRDTVYTRHSIPIIYTTHSRRQLALDCGFADFDAAVLHMVRIGSGESRVIPIIPNGGYEAAETEASA